MVASDAARSPAVSETNTAIQTTTPDTASNHTTTEQETSSSGLVATTAAQSPAVSDVSTATQTTTPDTADDHTTAEQGTLRAVNETSSSDLTEATTDVSAATGTDSDSQPLTSETSDTEQAAAADQDIIPETGSWTFYAPFYARAAAEASAEVVTTYEAGDVIDYTGTVVAGGDIWLKNQSAAGVDQYTAVLTESGGGIGTSIIPLSGNWTFHATYYGYAAADTSSDVLATYTAGEKIQYTGITVANDKIWLEYKPTDSAMQYIAVLSEAGAGIATSIIPDSGNWTFHDIFYGYAATNTDSDILATYNENDEIHYSGVKVANGDIWLTYQPTSGGEQYIAVLTDTGVAIPTSIIPMYGTWKLDDPCNAYATLDINTTPIKEYQAGESITYTSIANAQNYTWLVVVNTDGSSEYLPVLVRDNR